MYKIIGAIVALLLIVGGAIWYFASASSSSSLTRDKAASLVLAYLKQHPRTAKTGLIGGGLYCPNGWNNGAQKTLESEGYLQRTTIQGQATDIPTSQASQYVVNGTNQSDPYGIFSGGQNEYLLSVGTPQSVNVSQMNMQTESASYGGALVYYTETDSLTPFGKACNSSTTASGQAALELSDNGWSVMQVMPSQ